MCMNTIRVGVGWGKDTTLLINQPYSTLSINVSLFWNDDSLATKTFSYISFVNGDYSFSKVRSSNNSCRNDTQRSSLPLLLKNIKANIKQKSAAA